jgi:serine O-acetyltransferase
MEQRTKPADGEDRLGGVVEQLCGHINDRISPLQRQRAHLPLPNGEEVRQVVETLRSVLFPGYYGVPPIPAKNIRYHMGAALDAAAQGLAEQVERAFCFFCQKTGDDCCEQCHERSRGIVAAFLTTLPEMQKTLMTDVQAAYEGDPAATCPAETVFCYPGIMAVTNQRVAHELYRLQVPLIPRIITELAHGATGIDIHPGAAIGESFFIDHGTGVVVGETSTIGKGVRIYQGVTLGAKSFPLDEHGDPIKGIKRHPDVEDDVVIYAGATILGPVRIGKGSQIGGNVWLTHSLPPGSKITQADSDR